MTFGILDLLSLAGFKDTNAVLVRHQSKNDPVRVLLENNWFELYQAYQKHPKFKEAKHILSFYGTEGTRAQFYGVYRVKGCRPSSEGPVPVDCPPAKKWHKSARYFYDLVRLKRFDDLAHRVTIEWGPATQAWVQSSRNKPIIEILEPGAAILPPFEDYLEFSLSFPQLKQLFASENGHREWRARLQAVGGVYLILAETTGDLYVGSAYGEEGIWGRWRSYSKTGHGGNQLLRELTKQNPDYPSRFRFSILQILPKTIARNEIIEREKRYKEKLGTRAKGLNLN